MENEEAVNMENEEAVKVENEEGAKVETEDVQGATEPVVAEAVQDEPLKSIMKKNNSVDSMQPDPKPLGVSMSMIDMAAKAKLERKQKLAEVQRRMKLQDLEKRQKAMDIEIPHYDSIDIYSQDKTSTTMESSNIRFDIDMDSKINMSSIKSPGEDSIGDDQTDYSSEYELPVDHDIDNDEIDPLTLAVESLALVPSLSEISLDEDASTVLSTVSRQKIKRASKEDMAGKFRDTLDGTSHSDSIGEEESEEESSSSADDMEKSSQNQLAFDSDTNDDISIDLAPTEDKGAKKDPIVFADDLTEFLTMAVTAPKLSQSCLEEISVDRFELSIIEGFVTQLINDVVGKVERLDPKILLKTRLDKTKLHKGLKNIVDEYFAAKSFNHALNDRMVQYCRQSKNQRNLEHLPQKETENCQVRHTEAIKYLAYGLERVELVRKKSAAEILKAMMDLVHANHIVNTTESHLEQTIRRVIARPDAETDFLKKAVNRELRLMAVFRNEISDIRKILLTKTHTLGVISERTAKLEYVTEGVNMSVFVSTQANLIAMEKKLEEKNAELKKVWNQYHYELHHIQHNREKTAALKDKLERLKADLLVKSKIHDHRKNELCKLKLERKRIRSQIKDLTCRGGILAMPLLMQDYDQTNKYIEMMSEKVSALREKLREGNRSVLCNSQSRVFGS